MRIVIQRVLSACVSIENQKISETGKGMLTLLCVEPEDMKEDADYLIGKMLRLRIFNDEENKMNLNIKDIDGDLMIVSQFTLMADCRKGNRPSFAKAAKPDISIPLYEYFARETEKLLGKPVLTGRFGADMQVSLINDGPVTIIIDSIKK